MKRTMRGWTGFGQRKEPMKQKRKPERIQLRINVGNSKGCVKVCFGEQLQKGMETTQPEVTIML